MPLTTTAPLRREIERALPERPFTIDLWDGSTIPSTGDDDGPRFTVNSRRALAHLMRAPGELGLGRAYVSGDMDIDDLMAVMRVVDTWEPPPIDGPSRARLILAAARAIGLTRPPRAPKSELRPHGKLHSRERDERAVRHHYDVGNEFFRLFLDDSMTYSCAIFSRGAETLEQAQEAKLERLRATREDRAAVGHRVVEEEPEELVADVVVMAHGALVPLAAVQLAVRSQLGLRRPRRTGEPDRARRRENQPRPGRPVDRGRLPGVRHPHHRHQVVDVHVAADVGAAEPQLARRAHQVGQRAARVDREAGPVVVAGAGDRRPVPEVDRERTLGQRPLDLPAQRSGRRQRHRASLTRSRSPEQAPSAAPPPDRGSGR